MRWIIYGAGAIGGTIGARLHKVTAERTGDEVVLIARGEHGAAMAAKGLRFIHPLGNEVLNIPVVEHPRQLLPATDDVVLLCMKTQHTAAALSQLCSLGMQDVPIFCVQNGVANERLAARLCSNVYGVAVNLPSTHLDPGVVATFAGTQESAGGVLDCGRYPQGNDDVLQTVCAGLQRAGFAASPDPRVMAQKYAKLLSNLGNALELVLADRADFPAAGRALRAEALACYTAAGIDFVPLRDYIARNSALYTPVELADAPRIGGSTFQSLQRGAPDVETDYLNGEIALLGRLHGVATPLNSLLQTLARDVIERRIEPGSLRWTDIARETGSEKQADLISSTAETGADKYQ